jgi:hypothetical protein
LLSKARKRAKILKLKEIAHEQHVLEARKKQSQNTKRKKQQLQQNFLEFSDLVFNHFIVLFRFKHIYC